MSEPRPPDATVIVLTKNAAGVLPSQLRCLRQQATTRHVHLLVVDSGSTDETVRLARDAGATVWEVPANHFGHGRTRNRAAVLSTTPYCVYLTHDALPANDRWLESLLHPLDMDNRVAGTYSRHAVPAGTSLLLRRQMQTWSHTQQGSERMETAAPELLPLERFQFTNTSSAIRRELLLWYPFPDVDFGEDIRWQFRVLAAGFATVSVPESAVFHAHDYGLWEQFRQHVDHARSLRLFAQEVHLRSVVRPMRLSSLMRRIVAELRDDAVFLRRESIPTAARLRILVTAPLWHLARYGGLVLGERLGDRGVPSFFLRFVSHQEQVRRGRFRVRLGHS